MGAASRSQHDIAVVGARAAGAATALLLARMGHDVVVLDRALLPSDTLSTHSIARSGVVQLHRWGLLDDVLASGAPPIHEVTFHGIGDEPVTRRVKDRAGVDVLVAPRRHILDTIVADAAAAAGAELRLGHTVTGLRRDATGRVAGLDATGPGGEPVEIEAHLVVGADGLRSHVARAAGAHLVDVRPAGSATAYAYYGGVGWPGIEFFLSDGALAGIFPTHGGEACIWVCVPPEVAVSVRREAGSMTAGFETLLARVAPALAERLRDAERASPVHATTRLPNQVRQAFGPGWALVGDALYHRDAITGHGLSDAYRDAEFLATALDAGLRGEWSMSDALTAYRREAAEARRRIFDVTCALSAFPPVDRFVELQRRLSDAIEAEATALAARPLPYDRRVAVA
jgi:2-polyprenyl-6-methoxyphenol hydroxylase-like FAD-dependent oxidoreductase